MRYTEIEALMSDFAEYCEMIREANLDRMAQAEDEWADAHCPPDEVIDFPEPW